MKYKFTVKWIKEFTDGSLKGLSHNSELGFDSLDSAARYMSFLLAHSEQPVDTFGGSRYTCHMARIVTE